MKPCTGVPGRAVTIVGRRAMPGCAGFGYLGRGLKFTREDIMDRLTKGSMKGLVPAVFSAGILFPLFPGIAGAHPVEVVWPGQAATFRG